MAIEIIMPNLSQTTDEVHLVEWYVKVGEIVKKGDFLCVVETDKVTTEVESYTDGTVLDILIEPDTTVKAGTVIAVLGDKDEEIRETGGKIRVGEVREEKGLDEARKINSEKGNKKKTGQSFFEFLDIRASTIVKNMAKKRGIDLREVRGTGPKGIITIDDLKNFQRKREVLSKKPRVSKQKIELTERQIELAKNMIESNRHIPSYTVTVGIWMDRAIEIREGYGDVEGGKLSYDSIFIYALARGLKEFPRLNSYYENGSLILRSSINIGFAVSHNRELYMPVIRDADKKGITEIDVEIKNLVKMVRDNRIGLSDLTGGGITISNLGIYSVDRFTAIIPPKQACIIAIGRVQKTLFIDGMDNMRIRRQCKITGSFDHRIINGAEGAEFLSYIKRYIEEEL